MDYHTVNTYGLLTADETDRGPTDRLLEERAQRNARKRAVEKSQLKEIKAAVEESTKASWAATKASLLAAKASGATGDEVEAIEAEIAEHEALTKARELEKEKQEEEWNELGEGLVILVLVAAVGMLGFFAYNLFL